MPARSATHSRGFTLVEMVMVIVILGILGGLTMGILLQPFRAFQDQARRAALVAEGDLALTRMVRELRMAVPNSVRVAGSGRYLEFIPSIDGGRYRAAADPADPASDALDFSSADSSFEVVGGLPGWGQPGGSAVGDEVVIYNATASGSGANAYLGDNRATIASYSAGVLGLSSPKQFPFPSLGAQRFDIVPASGPVSYYCHGNQLRRHTGYGYAGTQSTAFTDHGALLADRVSLCEFRYQPGDHVRNGLVSLHLAISNDGETITLLYQAQVVNAP